MLADVLAWAVILGFAYLTGGGTLAVLGARALRPGDRAILSAWCGIVVLSSALLGASLFAPLTATVGLVVATIVALAGALLTRWLDVRPEPPHTRRIPPTAILAAGIVVAAASALTSDPVTLYDSLVYHIGIIRWLHEHGTVRGLALIHNRLGHVSAWLALAAPFDGGVLSGRSATIPLGVALVMVAVQGIVTAWRIAAQRATRSDWFLFVSSVALTWTVVRFDAANPSPDVAATALIVVVAWSMLVVNASHSRRNPEAAFGWRSSWLIPVVLAVGAMTTKLFAAPAVFAAALAYMLAGTASQGTRGLAQRAIACTALGFALALPFLAANLVTSGCPLFPSSVLCLDAPWGVRVADAVDYTTYIRDIARWETRRDFAVVDHTAWIVPWIQAHVVLTTVVVASLVVGLALLRRYKETGITYAIGVALLGIVFAAVQAPAPRFLFGYALIVPGLAVAIAITPRWAAMRTSSDSALRDQRGWAAANVYAALVAVAYLLPSQKVNLVSAIRAGRELISVPRRELLLPADPTPAGQLYSWSANDIELYTPVPRPISDTLTYRSVIDGDVGFERCSTAPLPCTPYLPAGDVRLRLPARGISGGFVRGAPGQLSFHGLRRPR